MAYNNLLHLKNQVFSLLLRAKNDMILCEKERKQIDAGI
jgi:hypothetical protein